MAATKKKKAAGLTLDHVHLPPGFTPGEGHHGHKTSFTSVRNAVHRGKSIKVRTTYRIEIDDEPLTLHTMVMDDGRVHCHGLPNYSFPSALDLARSIIDAARLAPMERDELGGSEEYGDDTGGKDHEKGGHH